MLRKEHLIDIVRNFILFDQIEGRQVKLMCRYQQFRAVHKAIYRLRTGKTRKEHGDADQRGGIIWHTQGSGKSLTMVFMVRRMRTLPDLKSFKVVVVTDRINLEGQLKGTAGLTGETFIVLTIRPILPV
jgi:type I restriction enzyme R subunit